MNKPDPDLDKVGRGFIAGGNDPDDVDGMITLYRRFATVGFMQRAIGAWEEGDGYIAQLENAGGQMQREIESGAPRAARVRSLLAEVAALNDRLTPVENRFVDELGAASPITLVRWRHPLRGIVAPGDFISLAEETGLIVPIGEWVLATACVRTKAWQDQGLTGLKLAVNLSARQFGDPMLLPKLTRIIRESGIEPSSLELEITESLVMSHGEGAAAVLESLKALGVQIAMDDFGTGYSSLGYLKRFPIDCIKIDRSFVRDLASDSDDRKITRAIIAMAHSMSLTVIAEAEVADVVSLDWQSRSARFAMNS